MKCQTATQASLFVNLKIITCTDHVNHQVSPPSLLLLALCWKIVSVVTSQHRSSQVPEFSVETLHQLCRSKCEITIISIFLAFSENIFSTKSSKEAQSYRHIRLWKTKYETVCKSIVHIFSERCFISQNRRLRFIDEFVLQNIETESSSTYLKRLYKIKIVPSCKCRKQTDFGAVDLFSKTTKSHG